MSAPAPSPLEDVRKGPLPSGMGIDNESDQVP
jgi:hypothetical protein